MAYKRSFWVDHVTDQHGDVIQYGTLLDQQHFNNMEVGISDLGLAVALMQFKQTQDDFQYGTEVQNLKLLMNSAKWPFNNKETTVALKGLRENTDYSVDVTVLEYSGGRLGNIRVKDRALNGFKLIHDGSATAVRVSVRISGGMTEPVVQASIG